MAATLITKQGKWNRMINIMHRNMFYEANVMLFDPRKVAQSLDMSKKYIYAFWGFLNRRHYVKIPKYP